MLMLWRAKHCLCWMLSSAAFYVGADKWECSTHCTCTGAHIRDTKKSGKHKEEENAKKKKTNGMPQWQKSSDPAGLVYILHLLSSSRGRMQRGMLGPRRREPDRRGASPQACSPPWNRTRALRSGVARGQMASLAGVPTARPSALGSGLPGLFKWPGLLCLEGGGGARARVNHPGDGMKGARRAWACVVALDVVKRHANDAGDEVRAPAWTTRLEDPRLSRGPCGPRRNTPLRPVASRLGICEGVFVNYMYPYMPIALVMCIQVISWMRPCALVLLHSWSIGRSAL